MSERVNDIITAILMINAWGFYDDGDEPRREFQNIIMYLVYLETVFAEISGIKFQ